MSQPASSVAMRCCVVELECWFAFKYAHASTAGLMPLALFELDALPPCLRCWERKVCIEGHGDIMMFVCWLEACCISIRSHQG